LLLLAGGNAMLLPVALTAGIVAQADTLAITLSLPAWQPDVRGVGHALRLRRTWLDRRARSVV
jgi:hypothetical protein